MLICKLIDSIWATRKYEELDGMKLMKGEAIAGDIPALSLIVGFVAAFVSGCLACKWMINIVKKGKLVYFGIYCAIAGALTLILNLLG